MFSTVSIIKEINQLQRTYERKIRNEIEKNRRHVNVIPDSIKTTTISSIHDLSYMPPLESDEEEIKGKGITILTPNKLLTRLPGLLAQIKAGNSSYKLKKEIRQILYLLYQHNKITKKLYNLIKSL